MPENLRVLRRKIRTTENIWQITRAMSMVSAVQLRRVQEGVERRREYFRRLNEILARISSSETPISHPYLREPGPQRRVGLVLAAGDRGLCGSYNANVFRAAEQFVRNIACPVDVIAVGAKAVAYARRSGWNIIEAYYSLRDVQETEKAAQICREIRQYFDAGSLDSLHIAYTRFVSISRHVPTLEQVLPIPHDIAQAEAPVEYIYEPSPDLVLADLLPRYVEMQVYHAILESIASEHSARMVTMRNATENANEMIQDLTLIYNKARQETITKELLDIVGGVAAVE